MLNLGYRELEIAVMRQAVVPGPSYHRNPQKTTPAKLAGIHSFTHLLNTKRNPIKTTKILMTTEKLEIIIVVQHITCKDDITISSNNNPTKKEFRGQLNLVKSIKEFC